MQAFLTSEKWKTLRHLVTDTERTANDLLAEAISLLAEKYREVPLMSPVVVPMTRVVVYRHAPVSHEEFVEFWERQYPDKEREKDERLYDPNIAALHQHTKCTLKQLFEWKFGVRFLEDEALNTHFIDRIECARRQPTNVTPEQFLHDVFAGGALSIAFWLHCWRPRFPIYDQHVHRAMKFISDGIREELDRLGSDEQIESYLHNYLPFYAQFSGIDDRSVDRALWSFGKFLKTTKFPLPM